MKKRRKFPTNEKSGSKSTKISVRDRCILELMFGGGIRLNELASYIKGKE